MSAAGSSAGNGNEGGGGGGRFRTLLSTARPRDDDEEEPPAPAPPAARRPAPPPEPVRMGRPANGRKSDPNYVQMTAYVPVYLHAAVKSELAAEDARLAAQPVAPGEKRPKAPDLSEVVENLLKGWLADRKSGRAEVR